LLEVGTGFHPEMTGRENIYMNGAIMGMTKAEITRKLDEIVDFSGVERYIDTPVKRYSSGMTVRLGFAIAAHLEPEILVVDEVLAVGDAEFQKKAIGKMQDVSKGEGRTVLFVSHNMGSIANLCNNGIVMDNGHIAKYDIIDQCITYYMKLNDNLNGKDIVDTINYCSPDIIINNITVNGCTSNSIELKFDDNILFFHISGFLKESKKISLELRMHDQIDIPLAFYSYGHKIGEAPTIACGEFNLEYKVELPLNINKGVYYFDISLTNPGVESWLTIQNGLKLNFAGCPTNTGLVFEYSKNTGFLFL
jgi:lipopolysaccharide transport system ATP-binding protein